MSDSGANDWRNPPVPPTTPPANDLPCIGEADVIELGAGGAADGNARMGTQMGGESKDDGASKLGGW